VPIGKNPRAGPGDRVVLVVEDEFLIAMELELLLQRGGWRVLGPAATVKEALCLLAAETPDVALLDVNLQGEMVTPVADALRLQGVPFVVASAYEETQLVAMNLTGMSQVRKPTNEWQLLAALAQAVTP
jgi:two-component system, response regulator PdtaR